MDSNAVEIFNGFNYLKDKKTLDLFGGEEKLNDFEYFNLVTGKTWEQYEKEFSHTNRIDYYLLENIKAARNILVNEYKLESKVANALVGKCIFVRYLVDRKVRIGFNGKLREWSNSEFCDLFSQPKQIKLFFNYLASEESFNGDLFPISDHEYKEIFLFLL